MRRCQNSKFRPRRGISLLEVMVATAVLTTAAIIISAYVIQGYRVNRFTLEQADAIEQARRGTEVMTKEIREADFSDLGSYPIASATNQSLSFYSNLDSDSAVEKIRYFLDTTGFKKGVIKPGGNPLAYNPATEKITLIAQFVQNGSDPIFYYYDGNYPSTTTPLATPANPNQVKLIALKLRVNIDPLTAPEDLTLDTFVQVRNLKDNL